MKIIRILLTGLVLLFSANERLLACTVCKSNQPKPLENITHGEGPSGITDLIIMWVAIVIVSITLFLSIKYLVRPKEHNLNHIKNLIINEFK